jgi:hypothetical protein
VEKNSEDIQVATKAFLKSQLEQGSFNDPGSFLWESERALLSAAEAASTKNSDLEL